MVDNKYFLMNKYINMGIFIDNKKIIYIPIKINFYRQPEKSKEFVWVFIR